MIQDIFEAPKTLSLLVGRVELQRDVCLPALLAHHFTHTSRDLMNGATLCVALPPCLPVILMSDSMESGKARKERRISSLKLSQKQTQPWLRR